MEACIARELVDTAGEMNGFLKPRARLFTRPLRYERAAIHLEPGFWPEIDREILAAYGITVPRSCTVGGPEEVDTAVAGLTPPFVVKVMSPDILHKSDVGGVRINLRM